MSDPFHDHLDACKQCADHPFGLCAEGSKLLESVATGLPSSPERLPTGRIPSMPEFDLRPGATKKPSDPPIPLMNFDYTNLELRILTQLLALKGARGGKD